MAFDSRVVEKVQRTCEKLRLAGKLLSPEKEQGFLHTFRTRFGPQQIASLDGEALLNMIHDHSNRDSLVYWLEFKNDEEFPSPQFGSIAGGSALKFIIYRRKETGEWTTGSPTKQRTISVSEAIGFARKHRDQLVRGAEILEGFTANATEGNYERLERQLTEVAPDVSPLAWGHKYFSLLFPDKIDDYHSPIWQRFHIIKMLRVPPRDEGRYRTAVHFVDFARELNVPMWWLTFTLNECHGRPHGYWRLGTDDNSEKRPPWGLLRENNCIALGWERIGDLSPMRDEAKRSAIGTLKEVLSKCYPNDAPRIGSQSRQLASFVISVAERDILTVMKGDAVLGICRVHGDYYYEAGEKFPHRRPVEWLSLDEWKFPAKDHTHRSFGEIGHSPVNLVEIERHILDAGAPPLRPPSPPVGKIPRLPGIPGRIQSVLERKSQVILYGPPGTGKTFWAETTARDLATYDAFGHAFDELDQEQQVAVIGDGGQRHGCVRFCCFHPAYGYEDFLEGYRPAERDGQVMFTLRPGIFRQLCDDAQRDPERRFYLIIDEINRGDIPRIFGELLTVLEKNKRGKNMLLPLTGQPFHVPKNVYVIGTMNTADRSIALLDTALRRRFGFIELMPDSSVVGDAVVEGIPLGPWLDALNGRILEHVGRDARNLQIGHAYLMDGDKPIVTFAKFARVVQDDVIPLLEEYCYEDHTILERILGKGLIDAARQQVRHELFSPERQDELIEALLAPSPEISATRQAIESEGQQALEIDEDKAELEATEIE